MKRLYLIACLALLSTSVCLGETPASRPSVKYRQVIPAGYHAIRDIPYVNQGSRSQSLDVYVPDQKGPPRPLVVWIHGGGWRMGDKGIPPGLILLQRGYVVASINYRLSQEAIFPAQIFDCKAAIRFLRGHAQEYDIDPTRIGVWGQSAGGHLAALLGTTNGLKDYEGAIGLVGPSSSVQAVCDWFGPSDLIQRGDLTLVGAPMLAGLLGGPAQERVAMAVAASPAEQVGKAPLPPFLIMHGDQDALVPIHQSRIFLDRLLKAGANAKLIVEPNSGHGSGAFRSRDTQLPVFEFFDQYLPSAQARGFELPTTRPLN
jgi:acetyl esterase/lipase